MEIIKIIEMIVIMVIGLIGYKLYNKNKFLQLELKQSFSQIKSLQVKFGKSFEHFVPFVKNFPGDIEKTVFLGMPIDFISFDKDTIKFIEIKTGQSQLSTKQEFIKNQIKNGKVEFKEVRY